MDIQETLRLHVEASRRREELLDECERLQKAGKLKLARQLLAQSEEIRRRQEELEAELGRGR